MTYVPWEQAWQSALYGDGGFFHRPEGPSGHFRTAATSRVFAAAMHRLAAGVDRVLGHPGDFTVVDVGAGRGELLGLLAEHVPDRWRLLAVEVAARPTDLADRIEWSSHISSPVTGVVLAHELLDAVPCVIAECGADGARAVVLVDPATGEEQLGPPVYAHDADWLTRWWPISQPGQRAEIGRTRDQVWCGLADSVAAGLLVAVDYDHGREDRAALRHGTLAAYRSGHLVPPVPDGTCDLTAHVAFDACAAGTPEGGWTRLVRQADALTSLGVDSTLPRPALTGHDPAAYAEALATAAESRVLLDPSGPGAFGWLIHGRGVGESDWEMMRQ
jgi:SAM-dependent MidA family methyltransferase